MATQKASNGIRSRREQLNSEHLRAAALRTRFPDIEQLRLELTFKDPKTHLPPPSVQLHTLFSAAPAFFRFACPCTDCDGEFDLTEAVSALVQSIPQRRRRTSITDSGELGCLGVRFRDRGLMQSPCSMQLRFQLVIEPHRAAISG